MAENTKKFLDFTGLQQYDKLLKDKVAADIKVVKDDLDTRKVKDTADSTTITWSKVDGTYTASVKGVVLDNADYAAVKTKATQSASAWTKFLEGSTGAYPDGITPALKDLATKKETSDALASAKSYTDGKVDGKFDAVGSAAQALVDAKSYADGLASNYDAAGAAAQALKDAKKYAADQDTANLATAKTYAEGQAATALASAKSYADGLADNYDPKGSADTALADAKSYADGKASAAETAAKSHADSVAATAKTEAISAANTYTDGKIKVVNDAISSINTSIAGGVHFIGISTSVITDKGTETPTIDGWTGPVKTGDIVINNAGAEFIWDGTKWQKLGDTTAELERIADLEGHVNTLIADENTAGSVKKALKDAKTFTTNEINTLVGSTGQVGKNTAAIAILRGAETVEGSVAKALKDAKGYADGKKKEATDYTDTKIAELVGSTGQVGKNKAAIATLNGNASTAGSVDYKIAQAVSNIEASIDTIPESDINSLFGK